MPHDFSATPPITLRLPDELRDRLEQSRIAAGERSPAAAIRRLLLQALNQEHIDDRLIRLIQTRVALPPELAAQYGQATQQALQAARMIQTEAQASREDIERLLKACLWLREDFSPKLTRQALLLGLGIVLGLLGGSLGGLLFALLFLR